jgi:aminoglycoside phosphotransferase (APT) family kinase protein
MPAPHGRDLELTRKRLTEWLEAKLVDARDVRLSELTGPGTTGFSNDTVMFDAEYSRDGARHRDALVARIRPSGYLVFPDYDLPRQFRVQKILGNTDVPVARMYWEEPDDHVLGAPFYVMERIQGRIPTDNPPYHIGGWMTEVSPDERAAIWWSGLDVLARIHRLDWKALGFDFLATPERGSNPLDQQLDAYREYLAWAARGKPQPTVEAGLEWLERNKPSQAEPVSLCWGDARIGNMIFHDRACVAVLDWEMVTLGNPIQDLGWWMFLDRHHSEGLDSPRLPGFPERAETVERYEASTGMPVRNLEYYEAFAGFRFGVIMIRLAQQMVDYGVLPEDSDFESNNIVTRLLAKILDLPAPG